MLCRTRISSSTCADVCAASCERSRCYVLRNARHPGLHRVRIHLVDEGALGVPHHPRHVERALASGATETGETSAAASRGRARAPLPAHTARLLDHYQIKRLVGE